MKKMTHLAVLSAISTVTVLMPLGTTLAGMAEDHSNRIQREIDRRMGMMNKRLDDTMREMNREFDIPSHDFSSYSYHTKYSSYSDNPHHHHYIEYKKVERPYHHYQQQHHHHHHHHVERNTYNYVERKTTKQSDIQTNNSGDAIAAGVLGLAAGTILGNILKQPEQPQIVYQAPPQTQVVYEVQPTYQSAQQSQTASWLQYCTKKYRSFNPKTGTFRGFDGLDHVCYAPVQ